MEDEQTRTMEVLQLAVRMETDGKEFYQKASEKSGNELGKNLFQQLAIEEDVHRKRFEQIFEGLKRAQKWPDIEPPSEKGKKLRSLFSEATRTLGSKVKVAESELEAIKVGLDMEKKSYDLYHSRSEESTLPVEKQFYEALAGEERGHHLTLADALEYLSDPAGFFTKSEHWSLDGA
jgi:rubrerythrin